jgi:hypothetical protein
MIRAHLAVRKAFRAGDCSTRCLVGLFVPFGLALLMSEAI